MNLLNLPRNNTKKNPNWMILTLSIVLLITIQIIPLFSTHNPIFPDSREYLSLSKSLYATGAYTFTTDSLLFNDKSVKEPHMRCRQPLYPLYLLLTYWIPGKHIILPIIGQIAIFSNILNRKKNIWKIFLVGNTVAFIISDSVLDVFNICAD